jgi:hypothetical protein
MGIRVFKSHRSNHKHFERTPLQPERDIVKQNSWILRSPASGKFLPANPFFMGNRDGTGCSSEAAFYEDPNGWGLGQSGYEEDRTGMQDGSGQGVGGSLLGDISSLSSDRITKILEVEK